MIFLFLFSFWEPRLWDKKKSSKNIIYYVFRYIFIAHLNFVWESKWSRLRGVTQFNASSTDSLCYLKKSSWLLLQLSGDNGELGWSNCIYGFWWPGRKKWHVKVSQSSEVTPPCGEISLAIEAGMTERAVQPHWMKRSYRWLGDWVELATYNVNGDISW